MQKIIIATVKKWNISNAEVFASIWAEKCVTKIITDPQQLTEAAVSNYSPDYLFFPHWSWIIPKTVWSTYECIVFHLGNLPQGRGGSPLQNSIANKIYDIDLCALRVTRKIDVGPVYLRRPLNIRLGSAEEILTLTSRMIFEELIPDIILHHPPPQPQEGVPTVYSRRTPEQSDLLNTDLETIEDFYDFVRMLDGEGYPPATIQLGKFSINFREAHFHEGKLLGRFEVHE
jgi:methionyl-tRNA formyltransferase